MKKKGNWTYILIILIFFLGLSLLLYPAFSNYWNAQRQTKAINHYAEQVADINREKYNQIWEDARAYNESLWERINPYLLDEEQQAAYNDQLNLGGDGLMGYVEIPSIGVSLPVYHGVSDKVLKSAVGHLDWSSLPVGGEGTHCLVSGHRGLPSAKLFTNLDAVVEGDIFTLQILDETLTYEVDQILVVEPHETDALLLQEGKDLCTLITCTPYAINTHRLLVRGHRVENTATSKTIRITADAIQIEPIIVAPIVATPMLLLLIIAVALPGGKKKKKTGGDSNVA